MMNVRFGIVAAIAAVQMTGVLNAAEAVLAPVPAGRVEYYETLLPEIPSGVGRPISDRDAWGKVAGYAQIRQLKADAEARKDEPPGELPDELYLAVVKTGDRAGYERAERRRVEMLSLLTIAECIDNRGSHLEAIERYLDAILSQRTWVAPAHDLRLINYNLKHIEVDLSASAHAWALATVDYWLGDKLRAETRERIRAEVRRRVIEPYLSVVKAGRIPAGTGGWWWLTGTNNWNAVCNAGVVGAGLALSTDRRERAVLVAAAEQSLRCFFSGFSETGYCSEGLGYWEYGFGSYLLLAETLGRSSGWKIDFLARPEVKTIGMYPERLEIMPGVYPSYADSTPGSRPAAWMLDYLERRLSLGRPDWRLPEPADMPFRHSMGTRVFSIGLLAFGGLDAKSAEGAASAPASWRPRDSFPDAQVFALRPLTPDPSRLAVSFKGGNNGEHHNHNDLGSYVVALGGKTPLLDPGMENYTRRTFGAQRYESRLLSSHGHPVPVVDGHLQSAGPQFAAKVLSADYAAETDRVVLDLRGGYEVPSLRKLERAFTYGRGGRGRLVVRDEFSCDRAGGFATAFLTYEQWRRTGAAEWLVGEGGSAVRVRADAGGAALVVNDEIIDESTPNKKKPTRIGIALAEPASAGFIEVTIEPVDTAAAP